MQPTRPEVLKGINYLKQLIQHTRVQIGEISRFQGRNAYLLNFERNSQTHTVFLSGEFLSDLPGTREYQESAKSYAEALENRMLNPSVSDFHCVSGAPLEIEVDWPLERIPRSITDSKGSGIERPDWNPRPVWDVFVCHASEDKEEFVKPLAEALRGENLKVWYDEFELKLGDSLRQSIDRGLRDSRFGVVVLSHAFFAKPWPQKELDGLTAREINGKKVILPIWHNLTKEDVLGYSPTLADKLAVSSSKGLVAVVQEIIRALKS